jgi:hypothetical protein
MKHICWDGCMFPNEVLMKQQTWNDILAAMIEVRATAGTAGLVARRGLSRMARIKSPDIR